MEKNAKVKESEEKKMTGAKVNPLRNERIFVRFVPHMMGNNADDKHHVLYGGRADGYEDKICVPLLRTTGGYKNVLTNDEKEFLEEALQLDYNALSVYNRTNNFWDNYFVTIHKEGLHLNLNDPEDYIRYCVLRANNDLVCPSVQELERRPKATYQYVIVRESEETGLENAKMDAMMQSYKEFGKIDNDLDRMRVLVELLDKKPYAENTKADFLRARINTLIQADPKEFLRQITDPMLYTKVLIRRGTELGVISKRGDYYYLKSDGSPLCDSGEDPTMSIAARYLNQPSHQDIKFLIESEISKK